ncbi:class I SAM-dependent methyltransferase [Albibacterium indicum]|uniref:class I SAM-dependent methyltransferase n=1 Tax=Albibacterium indicum TaxID=2292082 RepID=UPI001FE26D63|nr:hypothetical protein [Pedobacter indicus]
MKSLRKAIRSIVMIPVNIIQFLRLKSQIAKNDGTLQIIIGSAKTKYENWLATNIESLDILKVSSFESLLGEKRVDRFLAEHVFEHIHYDDAIVGLKNCNRFMKPGGAIRIAVPDGFHPNPDYINMVKPGGYGWGSDDHKLLYTYESLSRVLEEAGFTVRLLEYYDEAGEFHYNDWKSEDGHVMRSMRYDKRFHEPLGYSSLIVDGIKSE